MDGQTEWLLAIARSERVI